jgi:hypothetical protein
MMFYECHNCGEYHPEKSFSGDCKDVRYRFTLKELFDMAVATKDDLGKKIEIDFIASEGI